MLTEDPMASVSRPEPNLLALGGEIDLNESPAVREALKGLIDQKLPNVVIDMSAVSYIDSSGLAVLIDAMQRVQSYGGRFLLCGLAESVRTVFEIARLDQVFKIVADKAAAMSGA